MNSRNLKMVLPAVVLAMAGTLPVHAAPIDLSFSVTLNDGQGDAWNAATADQRQSMLGGLTGFSVTLGDDLNGGNAWVNALGWQSIDALGIDQSGAPSSAFPYPLEHPRSRTKIDARLKVPNGGTTDLMVQYDASYSGLLPGGGRWEALDHLWAIRNIGAGWTLDLSAPIATLNHLYSANVHQTFRFDETWTYRTYNSSGVLVSTLTTIFSGTAVLDGMEPAGVPEPGSLALIASGLLLLGGQRRRRLAASA